jgi:hypothetical protein
MGWTNLIYPEISPHRPFPGEPTRQPSFTDWTTGTLLAMHQKRNCFFNTWVLQQMFEANRSRETFPATCARACFAVSTFLRKLVLHLHVSVQQTVLHGRVFPIAAYAVNGLVLSTGSLCCPEWKCLFYSSWHCIWTYLSYSYISLYVTCGRVCPTAAIAASGRIAMLKQTVLPGCVYSIAAFVASGLLCSTAACAAPRHVYSTAASAPGRVFSMTI